MALFKKKEKKVTTYDGSTGQKLEGEAPAKIPELKVPRPPAEEVEAEKAGPDPTASEYFEAGRDHGFLEGLSFSINTLRQAHAEIIQRRRGG